MGGSLEAQGWAGRLTLMVFEDLIPSDEAEFKEDKMMNPAPGLVDFLSLVAHGGPREIRERLRLENSAGRTHNQTWRLIMRPVRGYFVFSGPTANRYKNQ